MRYNTITMEKITTAIIGGGASGLLLAARLSSAKNRIVLFERLDRVGKKLSSTGNGQGNITNEEVGRIPYFSVSNTGEGLVQSGIEKYGKQSFIQFVSALGGLCITDERGRVYPASRQASSITDLLRKEVARKGVEIRLNAQVTSVQKSEEGFLLSVKTPDGEKKYRAEQVVLCTGGKAAKNFGTDGNGYALAASFGHSVTALYPSLVQLKTDTAWTKTLKGIRAQDCSVTVLEGKEKLLSLTGDVIFTEYGVSGDAIFRLSAYIADKIDGGKIRLSLDFAPRFQEEALRTFLSNKASEQGEEELLCGVVNNQIGRAILKRANHLLEVPSLVKSFTLDVKGSLGYDYAQVTKGGIPLTEVDGHLQSKFAKGLYLTGEVLDVDGACGGFNLQWAYTSACLVADGIDKR